MRAIDQRIIMAGGIHAWNSCDRYCLCLTCATDKYWGLHALAPRHGHARSLSRCHAGGMGITNRAFNLSRNSGRPTLAPFASAGESGCPSCIQCPSAGITMNHWKTAAMLSSPVVGDNDASLILPLRRPFLSADSMHLWALSREKDVFAA